MDVKSQQIIIYFITFSIPILLTWYKLQVESDKDKEPFNWREIFASSIEIIITSIGFIYALVEKDSKFQFLYWVVIILLILGLIFERFKGKKLWISNMVLMGFTILLPSYFLFRNIDKPVEKIETTVLADSDLEFLELPSDKTISLKRICSEYLSDIKPIDEVEFSSLLKSLRKDDIDEEEKNLFMACLLMQKENYPVVEEYLKKVKSDRFTTDKSYIEFLINKSNYEIISKLELNENLSWFGIDKEKIIEAKSYIDDSYKYAIKILIFDSSAGRGRTRIARGNALKDKLKEFPNINVEAFNYNNTSPRVKIHTSGFYAKDFNKKGMSELKSTLRKRGYKEFDSPGNYIVRKADIYDIVIVTSK